MSRFGCFRPCTDNEPEKVCECAPMNSVIEGVEILDVVCPVSKYTGHRESPFKLLGKLTGAKADVLNAVLTELPTVFSDSRLTDQDRVDFMVSRLSTGTPAEDSMMAERIMNDLDALSVPFKQQAAQQAVDTIQFDSKDSEIKEE